MDGNKNDTSFLRAIAICLIINSHLSFFYANRVYATGGMIGNSLFFMLSSFGLFLSWKNRREIQSFGAWYGRRLLRIYPSLWVLVIILFIPYSLYHGTISPTAFLEKLEVFFFPPFWFLRALLLFYVLMYFILRYYSRRLLLIVATTTSILYVNYYLFFLDLTSFSIETVPFKLMYYFLVILWGFYLASIRDKIHFRGIADILLLLISITCIYAHKFYMSKDLGSSLQIVQHLATFPMLYYFMKIAKAETICIKLMGHPIYGNVINHISKRTLELFMVNISLTNVFSHSGIEYPVNGILFIMLTVVISFIIYSAAAYLKNKLFNDLITVKKSQFEI